MNSSVKNIPLERKSGMHRIAESAADFCLNDHRVNVTIMRLESEMGFRTRLNNPVVSVPGSIILLFPYPAQ